MLTVYRASAGSGKTFRLTGEYLKLLFQNSSSYRHILAVTFTNKATDEMKKRIISELDILAKGEQKSDYTDMLIRETQIPEEQIQSQAKKILVSILHDYSTFQVSTIDRFFQQTIRAFTREIGLQGGYNIELDTEKVLSEAVDRMLSEIDTSENMQLLDWLLRYSEERIETGKGWNIRNDIKDLAKEIFKENYKAASDEIQEYIADKNKLSDYLKKLAIIRRQFESSLKKTGEKAIRIIQQNDLIASDFKGGSKSPFLSFEKWANGEIKELTKTFYSLEDDLSAWTTKKTPSTKQLLIEKTFQEGLNECVKEIIHLFDSLYPDYLTAAEISRYFYNVGILGDIDKHIRQFSSENNIMLLSDTTQLLNLVIGESDTPFVYEKTGSHIHNYMIDEFQDTSGMQWNNFRPLIKDSLASNNFNLIVGDVKQSIYRWRNSDWNLLESQIQKDFRNEGITEEVLDTNYRSCKNIVEFNNAFFFLASTVLQAKFNEETAAPDSFRNTIQQVYAQHYQKVSKKLLDKTGEVTVEFIDTETHDDWKGYALDRLPEVIAQLQDQGFELKDIAVLVRTKTEGSLVADKLLQAGSIQTDTTYRYDVISDEALYIGTSRSVKLLISILRYFQNPSESINQALIAFEYDSSRNDSQPEAAFTSFFQFNKDNKGEMRINFPEEVQTELERIKQLPLYEMTENLINLFFSSTTENIDSEAVFIQALQDMILDFTTKNSSDISAFLTWWDETGSLKTITMPDSQNAIRILTVHKSKGLGFKAVLMPFCNWDIDHKAVLTTILWLRTEVAPFSEMPLIPVRYSSKLMQTIFKEDYLNEKMHAYIDNLNLAYVAFTRAKEILHLFAPKPQKDKISTIAELMHFCITNADNYPQSITENQEIISLSKHWNEEKLTYKYGHNWHTKAEQSPSISQEKIPWFSAINPENRLQLRLYGAGFFHDNAQRIRGNLMHDILSKVYTLNDLQPAVQEYVLSGTITTAESEEIYNTLKKAIDQSEAQKWFSGHYKTLNEAVILQANGQFKRPDRIMLAPDETVIVDYKFGEKEIRGYTKQLKEYAKLIQKAGYPQVKAYIWYVNLNKIELVV